MEFLGLAILFVLFQTHIQVPSQLHAPEADILLNCFDSFRREIVSGRNICVCLFLEVTLDLSFFLFTHTFSLECALACLFHIAIYLASTLWNFVDSDLCQFATNYFAELAIEIRIFETPFQRGFPQKFAC